jgi:hypothetical protein
MYCDTCKLDISLDAWLIKNSLHNRPLKDNLHVKVWGEEVKWYGVCLELYIL